MENERVLAMYDVRGIQKYIFRTAKVQDAIGASAIVEDIILDALKDAYRQVSQSGEPDLSGEFIWCDEEAPYEFKKELLKDVHVLFVGGGNAYVIFRDKKLCQRINELMSFYVMKKTYSLQLAVAVTKCTGNYQKDYNSLHGQMSQTKADMIVSKPLGALPVMRTEVKTGYPMGPDGESVETRIKKEKSVQNLEGSSEKRKFDNYVTKKYVDSTLAVVHIDGNNMGLRIRDRIENIVDYNEAVKEMRTISYHINYSFKRAFDKMEKHFNSKKTNNELPYFVRKILVAGDDITYVCNGAIALASIEFFCREISGQTMTGETDDLSIQKYGFSVCAGAAFMNSHFPFHIGYDVAEECCESAKERAKDGKNMDQGRIGNFVDFHICKNVHAQNLKLMRKREYQVGGKYTLLTRPYYISTENEGGLKVLNDKMFAFNRFKTMAKHFLNEENMPGSFVKELRNTYSQGENQMKLLINFLVSRGWSFPDGESDAFDRKSGIAKWYDALELLDYCEDLEVYDTEGRNGTVSTENNIAK